jgi:hypothetical protein
MTLTIADVSQYQGIIDWAAYGAQNPGGIARIHNSVDVDNFWQHNRDGLRANCKWRGFYQYLDGGADPAAAAHAFQATLGPTLPGEVMILDLEEGAGDQRGRRTAWLAALQDETEWVYSGLYFARTHLAGVKVEWLAAYGQSEPSDPHNLWQFTDARTFAGINGACDASVYDGTLAQLQALTGAKPTPPGPTKPPVQINHNTGLATEKPWGDFPLDSTDWYGVIALNPHNHSGLAVPDQRAVRQIQREVGVSADGSYGPQTEAASIRWQSNHHLSADGDVGPLTWQAMTVSN